jgi:hypothetical protein
MKYIIVEDAGLEIPIIFSELLTHKQVKPEYSKLVSAGFCSVNIWDSAIRFSCWGASVSLNVKSRLGEDEEILKKHSEFCG